MFSTFSGILRHAWCFAGYWGASRRIQGSCSGTVPPNISISLSLCGCVCVDGQGNSGSSRYILGDNLTSGILLLSLFIKLLIYHLIYLFSASLFNAFIWTNLLITGHTLQWLWTQGNGTLPLVISQVWLMWIVQHQGDQKRVQQYWLPSIRSMKVVLLFCNSSILHEIACKYMYSEVFPNFIVVYYLVFCLITVFISAISLAASIVFFSCAVLRSLLTSKTLLFSNCP